MADLAQVTAAMRQRDAQKAAQRLHELENAERSTLYYTLKRPKGSSWATVTVYAIVDGTLIHAGTGRFQPGASSGITAEVRRAATDHRVSAAATATAKVEELTENL